VHVEGDLLRRGQIAVECWPPVIAVCAFVADLEVILLDATAGGSPARMEDGAVRRDWATRVYSLGEGARPPTHGTHLAPIWREGLGARSTKNAHEVTNRYGARRGGLPHLESRMWDSPKQK